MGLTAESLNLGIAESLGFCSSSNILKKKKNISEPGTVPILK
jgi:hypothetical protein